MKSNDVLIALGAPILLGVLALWKLPAEPTWTICGFANLTGLPCPGCGTTRGLSALLHGEVAQALRLNPLCVPALLGLGWLWFRSLWVLADGQRAAARMEILSTKLLRRVPSWTLLLAVAAFWTWRVGLYLETNGLLVALRKGWLFRLFSSITN